ncbi:hypothetical protein AAFC00_006925 [Neodothiora populina]|uniref:FAD synthase n=1 Tax=Neodothiora populina TaxID=2781224 RepID=A0ABR3PBM0_9PEZI
MPESLPEIRRHDQGRSEDDTASKGVAGHLSKVCAVIHRCITSFLSEEASTESVRRVQEQTRLSIKIIADALERFSLEELSLSYNGGKDCLVLLILYLYGLHEHSLKTSMPLPPRLQSVYIVTPHTFPQVEKFVESTTETYFLDLAHYKKPMREAFEDYLQDKRSVRAIFVGTRRTDPHGGSLKYFDPTDRGWPSFTRIHPVIDWHYAEVWTFVRHLKIPYCSLYDLGYTSLGGTTDTHPNPALKASDEAGASQEEYRPAYELMDDDEERLGRDK